MTSLSTLDYVENFTISKSLNDRMWKLNFTLDKDEAPTPMTGIRAFATDYNDVEHCLFIGFIPGAEYIRQSANNKVSITAYDYSWYLTAQHICEKEDMFIYFTNVYDIVLPIYLKKLIGGTNSLNETGLVYGDCSTGCVSEGRYNWTIDMTAMQVIEGIEKGCNMKLHVFLEQSGDVYTPTIYLLKFADLDTHLPAQVTFTNPSDYVIDLKINENSMEDYNRIIVYGTDPETGDWYNKTEESAAVTAGEEKPIEYFFSDAKLTSQAKVDAKATSLYSILNGISATTYNATLTNRYDLRLLQKVKFMGYSDVAETDMRIISITYQRILNDNKVLIEFAADQSFSNLNLLARYLEADPIQTQQQVINDTVQGLANLSIGKVTAIDGSVATVELERSGNEVKARILV